MLLNLVELSENTILAAVFVGGRIGVQRDHVCLYEMSMLLAGEKKNLPNSTEDSREPPSSV